MNENSELIKVFLTLIKVAQIHIYDFVALGDQKKPPSKLKIIVFSDRKKRNKFVL